MKKNIKKKRKNKISKYILFFTLTLFFITVSISLFDFKITPSNKLLAVVSNVNPSPTPIAKPSAQALATKVIPEEGYQLDIKWENTGTKLIETGAIDMSKFQENYDDPYFQELFTYLTQSNKNGVNINQDNAHFWVNALWALGLTQKSDVLDSGIMGKEYKDELGNFASTGGWTLGSKDAVSLYSSNNIISLTPEQQKMVVDMSNGIFRPCCSNPTSFPDCNHGMAMLGLIELMASQEYSENEIYDAALAFNSYFFPDTYLDLAYYFQTEENTKWDEVNPKKILSANYSSSDGYYAIKDQIGDIPGAASGGASCGA